MQAADAEAAVEELRAEYGSVETIAAISAAIRARQGQTADARATLEVCGGVVPCARLPPP